MTFLLIARYEVVHFHKFHHEKFANGAQDAGPKLENDLTKPRSTPAYEFVAW